MITLVHYEPLNRQHAMGSQYLRVGALVLYSRVEPDVNPGETAKKINLDVKEKLIDLFEAGDLDAIEPALYAALIRGE
jgi:hypothetical protein